MMDEDTADSTFVTSENKSVVIKRKKKAIPEKVVKSEVSAKPKVTAATSTEPLKKTLLDLVCEAIAASGLVKVTCIFALLYVLTLPLHVWHQYLNSVKCLWFVSVGRYGPYLVVSYPYLREFQVYKGEKKGLSAQAIKKYVKSNCGSAAPNLNHMINKALSKGIESGKLERPPTSKDAKGAVGYFRLAKLFVPKRTGTETAPKRTVVKKTKPEDYVSDSETNKKPKPRKRALSDTYIDEMKARATSTPKRIVASKTDKQAKVPLKKKTIEKETSDTELVVKKTKRKSMKSYSSDTEVDFENKNTKTAKAPLKKVKSDKPKVKKADSTSKHKVKKLYNDGGKANEKTKSEKAKTKKKNEF